MQHIRDGDYSVLVIRHVLLELEYLEALVALPRGVLLHGSLSVPSPQWRQLLG